MADKTLFPLEDAKKAEQEDRLCEWVLRYLREEAGNEGLAKMIEKASLVECSLKEIPLSKFSRIIGPEEGLLYYEEKSFFESRVTSLCEAIKEGEVFPPLIVTDFWKLGEISDGGHRHEALLREGIINYPAVVCFEKAESLKFLYE